MQAILTMPEFTTQNAEVKVGDIVSNFGAIVRVEAIDQQRGLLVRIIAGGGKGSRYHADPAKCLPVR
jgi:hypothetical protein